VESYIISSSPYHKYLLPECHPCIVCTFIHILSNPSRYLYQASCQVSEKGSTSTSLPRHWHLISGPFSTKCCRKDISTSHNPHRRETTRNSQISIDDNNKLIKTHFSSIFITLPVEAQCRGANSIPKPAKIFNRTKTASAFSNIFLHGGTSTSIYHPGQRNRKCTNSVGVVEYFVHFTIQLLDLLNSSFNSMTKRQMLFWWFLSRPCSR
jgi:hypothetical protein